MGRRANLDGFGLVSPDHPVGSESLYLLRYPGPGMESVKVRANAHEPTKIRLTSCKRILPFYIGEVCSGQLKCDGTRAETRFSLSAKRTSPFKLAGASVQSTTGSRGVRISGSNAGYTMFEVV